MLGENLRIAFVKLTQGNINNNHLYLTEVMELFPTESVGGSSELDQANLHLEIHSGIDAPVMTDIAGDKKIFRKRAWVGEFFRVHDLKAGDEIILERTGLHRYHIYPKRQF